MKDGSTGCEWGMREREIKVVTSTGVKMVGLIDEFSGRDDLVGM